MKDDFAYKCFYIALKSYTDSYGRGVQNILAIEIKSSESHISQILKGKRKAGFNAQVSLAKACGYSYDKFLALGRKLLEGNEDAERNIFKSASSFKKDKSLSSISEPEVALDSSSSELIDHYKDIVETLKLELKEYRQDIKEIKQENKELRNENKELRSKNMELVNQVKILRRGGVSPSSTSQKKIVNSR